MANKKTEDSDESIIAKAKYLGMDIDKVASSIKVQSIRNKVIQSINDAYEFMN